MHACNSFLIRFDTYANGNLSLKDTASAYVRVIYFGPKQLNIYDKRSLLCYAVRNGCAESGPYEFMDFRIQPSSEEFISCDAFEWMNMLQSFFSHSDIYSILHWDIISMHSEKSLENRDESVNKKRNLLAVARIDIFIRNSKRKIQNTFIIIITPSSRYRTFLRLFFIEFYWFVAKKNNWKLFVKSKLSGW